MYQSLILNICKLSSNSNSNILRKIQTKVILRNKEEKRDKIDEDLNYAIKSFEMRNVRELDVLFRTGNIM